MVEELKEQQFKAKKRMSTFSRLLIVLVILVVIMAIILIFVLSEAERKEGDEWQAVFMTNGQTYFGHIGETTEQLLVLEDVHYIQTQTIPATEEGGEPSQQLTLVKLGEQEFHAPENKMAINWDHILFIETLRPDSQVVQTIEQSQQNQQNQ